MEDKVVTLLGEVATHVVLEWHLQGLKDVEINLPSAKQEFKHTQKETFESGDLQLHRSFHRMSLQEPTNLEQFIHDNFEVIKVEICNMKTEIWSSEKQIVAKISTKLEEVFAKQTKKSNAWNNNYIES